MKPIKEDVEDLTLGSGTLSSEQRKAFVLLASKLDSIEKKLNGLLGRDKH